VAKYYRFYLVLPLLNSKTYKMIKKTLVLVLSTLLFVACSTKQEVSEAQKQQEKIEAAPAGIEFQNFVNYKDVKSISLPMAGKEFKAKIVRADQVLPSIEYHGYQFMVWTNLEGFEGDISTHSNLLKRKLGLAISEKSQVSYEKRLVGNKVVAVLDVFKDLGHGYRTLAYGYLIKNGDKGTILFVKDGYFAPDTDMEAYKSTLDEVMQYMIKTIEFK
jgi:uncharacterized protein YcfL